MATYCYRPLGSSRRQIRLVELSPQAHTAWQTTLDCSIIETDLDNGHIEYEALSYVWGSDNKPYQIRVDGYALHVTSNLFSSLLHLRSDKEHRVLWIDAICINQACTEEREQQVSIMRDIYAQASRTIIWMGEFSFFRIDDTTDFLGHIIRCRTESGDYVTRPEHADAEVRNTRKIHESAWFSRMWIVQELACSKDAVICIGTDSIPWSAFVGWMDHMYAPEAYKHAYEQYPHMTQHGRLLNIFVLDRQRQAYQQNRLTRLLYLIFELRTFQYTNHLDQVYALVGITSNQVGDPHALPISYALDYASMRVNLLRHHTLTSGSWDRIISAGALQHLPASHLNALSPEQMSDMLQKPKHGPPEHTRELLTIFPRAGYAPFQRDWMLEPPAGKEANNALAPPDSVPYIRGYLIGYCLTPLGWAELAYLEWTTPPMCILFVEATPISHQIMEAFPITSPEGSDTTTTGFPRMRIDDVKDIARSLARFHKECANPDGSAVLKSWTKNLVPTILSSSIAYRQPWSDGMATMWKTIMTLCRWFVIGHDGYFEEFENGSAPEYFEEDHEGYIAKPRRDTGKRPLVVRRVGDP